MKPRRVRIPSVVLAALLVAAGPAAASSVGSNICAVTGDYSGAGNIVMGNIKNQNPGVFSTVSASPSYLPGLSYTVTLSGGVMAGMLLMAVSGSNVAVGTWTESAAELQTNCPLWAATCNGKAVTHMAIWPANVTSVSATWTAPGSDVGPVYFVAYVLAGVRGQPSQFYRLVAADSATAVMTYGGCGSPGLAVNVPSVTASGSPRQPTLHVADTNPPASVTGYRIRRSNDPSPAKATWPILATNVTDQNPGLPGVQWTDTTNADPGAGGTWYYQVTPWNSGCSAEGPF